MGSLILQAFFRRFWCYFSIGKKWGSPNIYAFCMSASAYTSSHFIPMHGNIDIFVEKISENKIGAPRTKNPHHRYSLWNWDTHELRRKIWPGSESVPLYDYICDCQTWLSSERRFCPFAFFRPSLTVFPVDYFNIFNIYPSLRLTPAFWASILLRNWSKSKPKVVKETSFPLPVLFSSKTPPPNTIFHHHHHLQVSASLFCLVHRSSSPISMGIKVSQQLWNIFHKFSPLSSHNSPTFVTIVTFSWSLIVQHICNFD